MIEQDEATDDGPFPAGAGGGVPPGFGGGDGVEAFGVLIAEAMMAADRLREMPRWQPALRLPGLRGAEERRALDALCRRHGMGGAAGASACSGDTSPPSAVEDVARFLGAAEGEVGEGPLAGTAHRWKGCPVLVVSAPGGRLHVVAPSAAARPADMPAKDFF